MSRVSFFEVEILDAKNKEQLCFLDKVEPNATVGEIKSMFHKSYPQWYPARQSIRLDPKGKCVRDDEVLQTLPVGTTATFYFKDLGPQVGWTTVFLTEYAGPLFIYLLFYSRLPFIYEEEYDFTTSPHTVVHLAGFCHSFHYVKRLIETLFVHRFSHGTMPLRNTIKNWFDLLNFSSSWFMVKVPLGAGALTVLLQQRRNSFTVRACDRGTITKPDYQTTLINCFYYWGFTAWLAYFINHPLYTPPLYGDQQVNVALITFLVCELGNFSIHIALRNLRSEGSKVRKIPHPTKNPFTWLFFFVSCPNYTYEIGSWVGFTVMTQCLPVGLFTLMGFFQMTVWAKGKHHMYLKEFKDYPTLRMPIIPFLL